MTTAETQEYAHMSRAELVAEGNRIARLSGYLREPITFDAIPTKTLAEQVIPHMKRCAEIVRRSLNNG